MSQILHAIRFSADKHRDQRRKDSGASPYINHPIEVAEILWRVGHVRTVDVIIAAILHDTLEDTSTTAGELQEHFGPDVLSLVQEVSDDKSLPKATRKQLQIEHASHKSTGAKQIKLADKICNVRDISNSPPQDWSLHRRIEYLDWASAVVNGLRGANEDLEALFDDVLSDGRKKLSQVNAAG
ncbi:MAG TPA: HD domain-containing protein [Blastocatellia bacterium]|nr:HD domain-containing protein [Blastocatellia bacterium]